MSNSEYQLNSHFISKNGCVESQAELTSFLAAGAFVDDMIWVSSSQAATQHILNVVSKFFRINDISINNDKTVAILINCRVANSSFLISGLPISVANKGESHWYLGIFLSTEGLSKPSLAKAHLDIKFFANLVLKKTISNKQFLYLVSSVLHPIVNYRTQFSFVPLNFPNDALHHPSFYGLKTFEQIQAEHKVAFVVCFANSVGILGHLFAYRSHDLQVLLGLVCIFHGYNLSLGGFRANAFCLRNGTPMVSVLGKSKFVRCLPSLWRYGIAFVNQLWDCKGANFTWATFKRWKKLDPHGPVSVWFDLSIAFFSIMAPISVMSSPVGKTAPQNILNLIEFDTICGHLLEVSSDSISVFTDSSLAGLGTVGMWAGAAVFFEGVDLGLGVVVSGLVSSTMVELQTIALALECVLSSSSVHLFSDKRHHIFNLIHNRNLNVCWFKVKGHFADAFAAAASTFDLFFPLRLNKHYILADGVVVSGNSRHFVGSGSKVLVTSLHGNIDWHRSSLVWHSDMHMAIDFTGKHSAGACTYFMKALHHWLPVAVRKRLYSRSYSSVLCLFCGEVKFSDHVFSCGSDTAIRTQLLNMHTAIWETLSVVSVFENSKIACYKVVEFVYRALMEKRDLIFSNDLVLDLVHGLSSVFSAGVVKLLGIVEAFGIHFGFHTSCLFFSGIGDSVSVIIDA
ncbi:hypothetical protein G9A89_021441 [Geosiphon pyriformis]|nr:hypothetical protein G9A89_021441 [Geosiphon pyriformis]